MHKRALFLTLPLTPRVNELDENSLCPLNELTPLGPIISTSAIPQSRSKPLSAGPAERRAWQNSAPDSIAAPVPSPSPRFTDPATVRLASCLTGHWPEMTLLSPPAQWGRRLASNPGHAWPSRPWKISIGFVIPLVFLQFHLSVFLL